MTADEHSRGNHGEHGRHLLPAARGDRYGLLLLLLVSTYVISAFTTSSYSEAIEIPLFVVTLGLALRTSRVRRRTLHLIMWIALVGSASATVLAITRVSQVGLGIMNSWTGLVQLLTVGVILRRILTKPTVSMQSIFGAVSAYMIIGLMFASFFAALSRLESGPFFAGGSPANTKTFQYFSFTTLTTLGYGDFTAAQNGGRAIAVMEALGGQVFLATLVARLVASYRTPRREAAVPALPSAPSAITGEKPAAATERRAFSSDQPGPPDRRADGARRPPGNGIRPRTSRPPVKWRGARRQ